MNTASIRLNKEQEKEIEDFALKENIDKSSAIRKLVEVGLRETKRAEALDMVRQRKWTLWKAASYCNESYRSFISLMKAKNIPFPISLEELQNELG